MGSTIICDKSSLQNLGRWELHMLRRYYSLNIPPVLCMEILGDLKKFQGEDGKREVRRLADKLVPAGSFLNISFRSLIEMEFAGRKFPMDGRAITAGGRQVVTEGGETGNISEVSPQERALLRWQEGDFEAAEQVVAAAWRQKNAAVDLEAVQRQMGERLRSVADLPSLAAVADCVDGLLKTPQIPHLYGIVLGLFGFHPNFVHQMVARLNEIGVGASTRAFPYTSFCVRAAFIFAVALGAGLVTTHHNTVVDLEYLFYIPFCDVFSSGDHFHQDMVPLFLTEKQEFVWRDELKSDLKEISDWWDRLNEQERARELDRSGPPENASSRTHQIWRRFMGSGYREREKLRLTSEQEKRLVDHCVGLIERSQDTERSTESSSGGKSFLVKKSLIRLNAPCFCGSKRIAKECCFRYLSVRSPLASGQ